jgi:hypothetical protein
MIGNPFDPYSARIPDGSIDRVGLPVAIIVEVIVAVDVPRDILCGKGIVLAIVTRLAPGFEVVKSGSRLVIER